MTACKIKRAGALDGSTLDVELTNGHTMLIDFTEMLKRQPYSPLSDSKLFCSIKTDGENVIWDKGITISLEKLFNIIKSEGGT